MNLLRICLGMALALFVAQGAFAQKRLLEASDLVSKCAATGQRVYCDSALKMVANQPHTEELHLVRGNAYYNLFQIERERALAPAMAAIGAASFTPNRGYQFIGEAHRLELKQRAELALFHFRQVKHSEEARLSEAELQDMIDEMKMKW